MKNLAVSNLGDGRADLEILRYTQDDKTRAESNESVILSVAKYLAVSNLGDGRADLEILRYTQDDKTRAESKEQRDKFSKY